jgi:hypothetical protein
MRSRAILILGLLLLSLTVQGESCLLDQRKVSAVLGTSVPAEFATTGFTESSGQDSATVIADADSAIRAAIEDADIDVDNIKSIAIAGGCYEVLESTGHDARRQGSIFVDGRKLLDFDVPTNATGTQGSSGDGTLTLDEDGVTYLNGRLNEYLDDLQSGGSATPFVIQYDANWTSTPAPTQGDPDNFRWFTCINLQVEYQVEVDVPNPL